MTEPGQPSRNGRLLVLTINYAPEPTGFAPHVTAYCEHMARAGWRVTVLTGFPFAPLWKRWDGYQGRFSEATLTNGVRVIRNTHFIPRRPRRMIERLLMEGTFCLSALWAVCSRGLVADAVVYVGAQPSIAWLARLLAAAFGCQYGVMINDIASGAAQDVGIVKSKGMGRLLASFEYGAYLHSGGAIVLCDAFRRSLVERGYAESRVRVVRSPVDIEQVRPLKKSQEWRSRFGLSATDFVILFAGSMGLKQGLPDVVSAAAAARSRLPQARWVLVGEGEVKAEAEALAQKLGLSGVVLFVPFQPAGDLAHVLGLADVLLLNQLASVKDTVVPSKLLTYMAAGRPVLAAVNAQSQGAEILGESGGGIVAMPENPEALVEALLILESKGAELEAWGARNRHYAEAHFDLRDINRTLEQFTADLVVM